MTFFKSSDKAYSGLAKVFHWLTALAVFVLFGLGMWMDNLSYNDAWYRKAPALHMSIGVTLAFFVLARVFYRLSSRYPKPIDSQKPIEKTAAKVVHLALYILMFVMFISGYLIATAKGDPLVVFDLFSIPAVFTADNLEDQMGELHEIIAFIIIGLAVLHGLAALKHHFMDKDSTLKRMTVSGDQ